MAAKLESAPPLTLMSPTTKLVVASLEVNVIDSVVLLEIPPSDTSAEVIAIVGATVSKVQLNWLAAVLLLPELSVYLLMATSMVFAPLPDGVKVAVYVVPDPEKLESAPPPTVMSPTTKFVVASFEVKIMARVESFEVAPSATVDEVIAMVGTTVSKVQLN